MQLLRQMFQKHGTPRLGRILALSVRIEPIPDVHGIKELKLVLGELDPTLAHFLQVELWM